MADSPLHHSWPSFSKLWMKRWSFKRASECKPCVSQRACASGTGSASSLSPPPIAEDVFFTMTEEKDTSCESDYEDPGLDADSSVDDISGLDSSLRGSEFFRDLAEGQTAHVALALSTPQLDHGSPPGPHFLSPGMQFHHAANSSSCPGLLACQGSSAPLHPDAGADVRYADMPGSDASAAPPAHSEAPGAGGGGGGRGEGDMDSDVESFPLLVRSMSTSRRHSWEAPPLSPLDPGRRFSLDTAAMDSDGEREEDDSLESSGGLGAAAGETDLSRCKPKETEELSISRKTLFSRSDILASDQSRAARLSRVLETSKQAAAAEGAEDHDLENLQTAEGQCRIAKQRTECREETAPSENVTWYEFLSKENDEEEEDRAEKVEKGRKVKRTLSNLKNRMAGSFNKDKGKGREKEPQKEKGKEREPKEKSKLRRNSTSGHQLVPGIFSNCATCSLCSKSLLRKHGLQCVNCAVNVHKNCRTLLAECSNSKSKQLRDSLPRNTGVVQSTVQFYNQALRDQRRSSTLPAANGPSSSAPPRATGMTITPRAHNQPAASANAALSHNSSSGSIAGEMDETDGLRFKPLSDDSVSLAPSTAESVIVEDAHYAALRADLEADAQDLEPESWSLAVDQSFLKGHPKEAVKRQDVIYELMQTEMHHVRTLKIMLRVYAHAMREDLQLEERRVERIFPQAENLLENHRRFLSRLKERRRESLQPGSEHNYAIQRLGDVLCAQFSGEAGDRIKESYSEFCGHHNEALSYYKELQQNSKKFQSLMRKISNLSIVRRMGVPECILLVTQRITKYPVLVERILQNTEAGTEDHEELTRALGLIKDAIMQVDTQVNECEKLSRLKEIAAKMEPKSLGKIKDGRVFRREDLCQGRRKLLHEGTVNWKAASGRLKDVLAVLLSDVLLLLQEKDQKYTFSTVDNKPSVISLQKLIVREVAHEEKAMFLICASSKEPEMYEIHTSSKEERNIWMPLIRQAVESCPHMEEGLFSEQEAARASRLKEIQERLSQKDAQIAQSLTEKLQIFADCAEVIAGLEDTGSHSRLLLRGDASDLQQGEQLLKGAITEVENLQNLLLSGVRDSAPRPEEIQGQGQSQGQGSGVLPRRADTFGGYDSSTGVLSKNGSVKKTYSRDGKTPRERSQRASSDPQLKEICAAESLEEFVGEASPADWNPIWSNSFPEAEFFDRVLMLSQRLYSLQAIISQQDSHIELQRASLTERERPGRHRGNVLLEQEKQRNLEKQREELASFQKLQSQHRQEQARWERERQRQRLQTEASEARLRQREEECRRLEARLAEERQELERQREKYQQDLERLRDSTRAVEKEKERLEQLKKFKKHKTIANPGLFALDPQVLPLSSSFNGELLMGGAGDLALTSKPPHVRSSLSIAPGDYLERRESGNAAPVKTEVPIHLISTTNQLHKQGGVQQQIPTKLAALSKGREKSGRAKGSQRSESSASVDMKQMLPLKLSGREDGSLRAKRSVSPLQLSHPDPAIPPESHPDPQPAYSGSVPKQPSQSALQNTPPAYTATEDVAKEDVIFF
ncbi:rho guanine nucleotide exchange factor 18 isoform X3 [Anguilla anguilla]|uniref:rho guanine nucleotide exchange factor 18 isoform X3 n=1 Tax=Anguilla anguilla TaxID=7936 RepID=UPI0015AE48BD|nr:rho guanine nucleotide exchange factor 18 isoform X3 [Anguilla anguilla]